MQQQSHHRTTPTASPKKKARHVVTRQIFALPALQQFEPVLASSPRSYMVPTGSIPKIERAAATTSSSNNAASGSRPSSSSSCCGAEVTASVAASPSVSSLSPGQPRHHAPPHRPPKERESSSPRVPLRPQPPPPVGISVRADVDIYRYNQGTTQRMAIRPIFEQRKEEAHIARQILTQREEEQDVDQEDHGSDVEEELREAVDEHKHDSELERQHPQREGTKQRITSDDHGLGVSIPADKEEEIQEFTTIKFVSPRSADTNQSRMGSGKNPQRSLDAADKQEDASDPKMEQSDKSKVVKSVSTVNGEHETHSRDEPDDSTDTNNHSEHNDNPACDTGSTAQPESQLVRPLLLGRYHEPFRSVESDKLSRIKEVISPPTQVSNTPVASSAGRRSQSTRERVRPEDVLYKVLWKDLRTFGDRDVMLSVLLSSEAAAHIVIANQQSIRIPEEKAPTTSGDRIVPITESHLEISRQMRRDLRVLTPKWSEWILSRVHLDTSGKFYSQLEDKDTLENARCFDEQLIIDGCKLHVEMYAIGNGTNLLVSVHDIDSGETSKIFLNKCEILELAISLGIASADGLDTNSDEVSKVLQDAVFLLQIATKSTVIRLGMKNKDYADRMLFQGTQQSDEMEFQEQDDTQTNDLPLLNLPSLRCAFYSTEVYSILLENSSLAAVAFLSQAHAEDGMACALRHLQQREAVQLHAKSYMLHHHATSSGEEFSELIAANVEAAKEAKLKEIAIYAIIEDMVTDLIAYESRVEIYEAKYSGGYDDHYASKVQAAYRMSTQRKNYTQKKRTRMRAARLLQALQRGIIARKRYCEMKIEREKYLFYGFRSSLHHSAERMENPKQRAQEMAEETERRRQTFLMQVLEGYIAEHGIPAPHRVLADLVENLFNEYGVVVGCPMNFGEIIGSFLRADLDGKVITRSPNVGINAPREPPRLYSTRQINAALLLGLRSQYDDTFGLSSATRKLVAGDSLSGQPENAAEIPPRWLLKINAPFQRSNRNRLAILRLSRKTAGRKSSHLVARDFRNMLSSDSMSKFETCRKTWEASIRVRRSEHRIYDSSSRDEVVQRVLDHLVSSIKDWGVDPEPLFAGLNLCVRHRQGKEIVGLTEAKFNAFAEGKCKLALSDERQYSDSSHYCLFYHAGVNKLHGKRNILSLREEIEQELEDFEKLLALRCLNIGHDHIVTVPPSEILHIVLKGKVDDEYIRHALPTVLPIASIADKYELVRKMVLAYANASYGNAINTICWSCLDVSENVTVESAQLLDRITRADEQLGGNEGELHGISSRPSTNSSQRNKHVLAAATVAAPSSSVASRALYLLTGAQAVKFLQFLAKVAHFNKTVQYRTLALLKPYVDKFELHRLASTIAGLDDYDITSRLFDECFAPEAIYPCTRFWIQYEEHFGLEQAEKARADCPLALSEGTDGVERSGIPQSAMTP